MVEAVTKALSGHQPLPGPDERRAAAQAVATATASRASGSRSATAPATSCSPPATRCSSRAPSSSTRGRRFSVYPHLAAASGARAIEVPLDDDHHHQLDKMREEITAATRLVIVCNPNNPTSTALPLDEIAEFVEVRPAPRRGDPRRGLRRVQRPAGPRRVGAAARASTRTSCCCGPSARSTGCAGCASATRCAARRRFRTAVDQVRQPFFCNAAAQAAALEALNHTDEVTRRVERNLAERIGLEDGLRELGDRARGVPGQLRLVRPRRGARRGRRHARAGRARHPGARRRGARARRARCGSRSARRPRTSASWKRSPRCCKLAPRVMASTPASTASQPVPGVRSFLRVFHLAI